MYQFFNPNDIKPHGWLKRQLEIQAEGLSGHLDEIWPDVRDSAWIGGSCEGWERVPYWLDGFIPLAWLLERDDLKAKANRYITAILDRQQADGWICPCAEEERKDYDMWAHLLIGKVLALYCDFTGDERAETALYRAMKCLWALMKDGTIVLHNWGKFRWYEGVIPLKHLCSRGREDWMLELAELLHDQGADYDDYIETWKRPMNRWLQWTHIVNMGMMLKADAVYADLLGRKIPPKAEKQWKVLEKYNGTVVGTFNGDECLSGVNNNQGFELCSVVELMYSCEWLYALTGDAKWADRLEKASFNALPATISDDMWSHQYDQQVNQIACQAINGRPIYSTNGCESGLFGLEPNFGCCTANMHQGWPKLVMSTFLRSENGVHLPMLTPGVLETEIGGAKVRITVDSLYPFRHEAKVTVETDQPAEFDLTVRIPAWAEGVKVNGQSVEGGTVMLGREWAEAETLTVTLEARPVFVQRPYRLKAVQWGALVFALPIEAEWVMHEYERKGVERKFPYCDYELLPKSEWRWGFEGEELIVREGEMGDVPFSAAQPPVTIEAGFARVAWEYAKGYGSIAVEKPRCSIARSDKRTFSLVPYGAAKLRMTEMPLVKRQEGAAYLPEEPERTSWLDWPEPAKK